LAIKTSHPHVLTIGADVLLRILRKNSSPRFSIHDTVGAGVGSIDPHDWQVFGQTSAADPISPKLNPDLQILFPLFIFDTNNKLRLRQVLVLGPDGSSLSTNLALGISSQATVGDNDGKSVEGHFMPHVNLHTSAGFSYSPRLVCLLQILF